MEQWWLGLPGTMQGALITIALLPWVGLATGQLMPRWVVAKLIAAADSMTVIWKDLYTGSEVARSRAVEAMERGADAMEDSAALVKAVMTPLRELPRDDST